MTRRPRPGIDDVLAAVTFVVSLVFSYGPDALRMSLPAAVAISIAAAAAVWLSGRRPATALWAVGLLSVGLPLIGSTFAVMDLVIVFVVFQAAMSSSIPVWVVAAVGFVTLTVDDVWQRIAFDETLAQPSVLYPVLLTALSVGLGVQSRLLRDTDRRRAVLEERRRIARDLHDVAAHHLSALVVHNKVARRVDSYEALHEASDFTARTAAEALDSLRGVVRVLTTEDGAPLQPQPVLADIDDVVARMEAAGLEIQRDPEVLPPTSSEVDGAVVRIAQEALANVLRHRGPGRCWLTITRLDGSIAVTVEDDGPTARPHELGQVREGTSGRYGLIGMRERAEACGGHLMVGPSAKGGWSVSAVLPVRGS